MNFEVSWPSRKPYMFKLFKQKRSNGVKKIQAYQDTSEYTEILEKEGPSAWYCSNISSIRKIIETWVGKSSKLMEKDHNRSHQKYLFPKNEFYIFRKFFLKIESKKKFEINGIKWNFGIREIINRLHVVWSYLWSFGVCEMDTLMKYRKEEK